MSVGITLNIGSNMRWVKALSQTTSCYGETCNELDPIQYRCDQDAVVVEEARKPILSWQNRQEDREIVIQKLYSQSCRANWTNAYVPNGAFLFIREQQVLNGTQPVRGMSKANGSEYFWAQSRMSNSNVANQACVSIPLLSIGIGHDLYNHHCTDFN